MQKINRNCKRLSIWILILTQMLLILSYFYLRVDENMEDNKITFVSSGYEKPPKTTYHTAKDKIFLKTISTRNNFIDFNSSLCYINGSDLVAMKRSKNLNWECNCLPGWHGKDCGEPEVVWRALLTYRKPVDITGPRAFARKIIYILELDKYSETITEIQINELGDIIDLFVLHESSNFFQHKLNNQFLKKYHNKILYIKTHQLNSIFNLIRNLRDDDIILKSNRNEIPNKFVINYLKYYNNWPEPVYFRLKWSVFGFFWIHPSKTKTTGSAYTVLFLKTNLSNKIELNYQPLHKGIIFGDLNHFGGWYCDYCSDIEHIIESLNSNSNNINLNMINQKKIDTAFMEDVIENGLYIDGKTELLRAHRYHDNYFAPYYVLENNWNYEFLLTNLYSKIDYG